MERSAGAGQEHQSPWLVQQDRCSPGDAGLDFRSTLARLVASAILAESRRSPAPAPPAPAPPGPNRIDVP